MAINLDTYKQQLLDAWKEVVDDNAGTDWALFSYEANTNTLKVVGKGDGGLEEMVEDLNSGKIMYAFCKVMDPTTSLPKFVLINWQGEAAPLERKGKCANHVTDVKRFFKGVHVTINARTEDDVDTTLIIDKVAKSTVSTFNFKERSAPEVPTKPVGSVYKRTIPKAEINAVERDKFWEKEEAEERIRVQEEKKKAEEIKNQLEEERKRREIKEAEQREAKVKERMRSITELRASENVPSTDSDRRRWEQQMAEDRKDEETRRRRSESLRKERKEEAESLISQRTINARAIFEQNTAEGQMNKRSHGLSRQSSYQNGVSALSESSQKQSDDTQLQMPDVIPTTPTEPTHNSIEHTHAENNVGKDSVVDLNENSYANEEQYEDAAIHVGQVQLISEGVSEVAQQFEDYNTCQVQNAGDISAPRCLRARALYDYQAADETEISFDPDDIITHIEQIDEGWWQGAGPDGNYGLFPANYVELLE